MKLLTDDKGLTAREVNPLNSSDLKFSEDWDRIEANIKSYPLTTPAAPNLVCEGNLVWQYLYKKQVWVNITPGKPYSDFKDFETFNSSIDTRQAYAIHPAQEAPMDKKQKDKELINDLKHILDLIPGVPQPETLQEAAERKKPYFDDFDPKYKELHDAIDKIVTKVGYKDFAMAVLKYQVHNLSQYQLIKSWK